MSKAMTPWFRGTVPPARSGVYPVRGEINGAFAYFDAPAGRWSGYMQHREKAQPWIRSGRPFPKERTERRFDWRGFTTKQD